MRRRMPWGTNQPTDDDTDPNELGELNGAKGNKQSGNAKQNSFGD